MTIYIKKQDCLNLLKITLILLLATGFESRGYTQETVNVKAFGAKGDGRTEDTQAILKAVEQLLEHGGKLYFPSGTYITRVIDIRPKNPVNIVVYGDGMSKTIVKKSKNDPTEVAVFFCEIPKINLSFSNLSIDGSANNRPSRWRTLEKDVIDIEKETNGIFVFNVNSLKVANCSVYNLHGKGIACFSAERFEAINNKVQNTQGDAIVGHRVNTMLARGNTISNAGMLPEHYILDGKPRTISQYFPQIRYGDGILGACNYLEATNNIITNAVRCGIVHDIARDLGYFSSKVIIKGNQITVNSNKINNSNPPAGMWFEQSGSVAVTANKIYMLRSHNQLVSGIRFYGITNQIVCNNNLIDASTYNLKSVEGIGIFEPYSASVTINNNEIKGKFEKGINFSYGKAEAKLKTVFIHANSIQNNKGVMARGIEMSIDRNLNFAADISIRQNVFSAIKQKPINLYYYGGAANRQKSSPTKLHLSGNRSGIAKDIQLIEMPKTISLSR